MLTVMRFRPASFSGCASPSSRCPFVVSARSSGAPTASPTTPIRQISRRIAATPHHLHQSRSQQRLASGQPDLLHSQRDEQPHHPQVIRNRQLGILRALVARPAIDAFVVAAVSHRDAKVRNRPAKLVPKPARRLASLFTAPAPRYFHRRGSGRRRTSSPPSASFPYLRSDA